jgi:hypothetical protein
MTRIVHTLSKLLVATAILSTGCVADAGGEAEPESTDSAEQGVAPLRRGDLPVTFRRVVLGRVLQHEDWTLPKTDTNGDGKADLVRDTAYVCDVYAKLAPTYVSGLVRIDGDEPLTATQIDAYRAIRSCLRDKVGKTVRFDFVLNAEHYDTPKAVEQRLAEVHAALDPDVYFFDFYQAAYRVKPNVVAAAVAWVHAHDRVVGGNVWGHEAPPGSDFVAVDDASGLTDTADQIRKLRADHPSLPILMHLENNPGHEHNLGEAWMFDWDTAQRESALRKRVGVAHDAGARTMMPVFFPLSAQRKGDYAAFHGPGMIAYDAAQDGDMIHTMKDLLGPVGGH